MSLLFRILRAAHASGTHHKLALDALVGLEGPDAEAWRRLFLAHAKAYMKGAKAPDDQFKDFKNHVLHVRDGWWGGAVQAVETWYAKLLEALRQGKWSEAAFAAGVLSHYYVDPIHPFHTGQSEAENNVHRAVEWSISRSYDALARLGETGAAGSGPALADGPDWLRDLVRAGAEAGNRHYEALLAHYDLQRGVVDPPAGLDSVGRRIIADLIVHARTGFARLLGRALAESGVAPPAVDLKLETVIAGLEVPLKLVARRLEDAADRRQVERMYDELVATGRVEQTLGEAERTVRELHASEVRQAVPVAATAGEARALPVEAAPPPALVADRAAGPATAVPIVPVEREQRFQPKLSQRLAAIPASRPSAHLDPMDDVERAPSIGPRTAERLATAGIRTVADLLAAEPEATAKVLDARHIDAAVIRDWQDQAHLVITVPGLRGGHAQLLVGAGFRTREALATAEPDQLCARVLAFAATADGHRVLRDGPPPDIARIKGWLETARLDRAA